MVPGSEETISNLPISSATLVANGLSKIWSVLLDIVYPPRCGGCDRRGTLLCADCLSAIGATVGGHDIERLDAVISAGLFRGPLRSAVHKLKYESDTPLARPLALLISEALAVDDRWIADDGEPPTIVPVPLHSSRKRARGYNQSELLANELSRITGWPLDKRLVRVKSTRPQVGLHADERHENVLDAFRWQTEEAPLRVILVDDVCTTGATLSECAFALMSAGTEHIFAATAARAIGGTNADT
jgi:ComF family protein